MKTLSETYDLPPREDILLAVLGLRRYDIEALFNVANIPDGSRIRIRTRGGGENRPRVTNDAMRALPSWINSVDDPENPDFCIDVFNVAATWRTDITKLPTIVPDGMRPQFAAMIATTLNRMPTPDDEAGGGVDIEERDFFTEQFEQVFGEDYLYAPRNDRAMAKFLALAEANAGHLKGPVQVLPLMIRTQADFYAPADPVNLIRLRTWVARMWEIDDAYWTHCKTRWATTYPQAIALIETKLAEFRAKYPA